MATTLLAKAARPGADVARGPPHPWRIRPLGLLAAFFAAKAALAVLCALDGRAGPLASAWAAPAMLSADLATAAALLLLEAVRHAASRRRPRLGAATNVAAWMAYAAGIAWTALNVPVARVLSTPLTVDLAAAAGGALSDSIARYVTPSNLLAILAVVAVGAAAPRCLRGRAGARIGAAAIALAAAAIALGPVARARVDLLGLHRNALAAFVLSAVDRLSPRAEPDAACDVEPPAVEGAAADLRPLAGVFRGLDVVLIVLESTAAQYLASYGARRDPTPNLTALASRGVVFENAYAVYPESIKGLHALLCSAAPAAHTSAARYAQDELLCTSLARTMKAAGYSTGLFHSGRFEYLGMEHVVRDRGFDALEDAGTIGGEHATSFGVADASTVRRVLAFVDALPAGAPYFAMVLPIAGHHPYESPGGGPRPFGDATDLDRYLGDLYRGDLALGTLLEGLRQRRRLDRTAFVIVGDHGEAFFQHPGNFAHSLFLYEENVRVPLFLAAPGTALPAGIRAPQVASTLDVAPTILDLVGVASPRDWRGRSLLEPAPGRARFLTDHGRYQFGLREGRWKFVHDAEAGRSSLYDLGTDPGETRDVAALHPSRAREYRDDLVGWSTCRRVAVARGGAMARAIPANAARVRLPKGPAGR